MVKIENFTQHIIDFSSSEGTVRVLPCDTSITGRGGDDDIFTEVKDDTWAEIKEKKFAKKYLGQKMIKVTKIKVKQEPKDEKKSDSKQDEKK